MILYKIYHSIVIRNLQAKLSFFRLDEKFADKLTQFNLKNCVLQN